MNISHSKPIEPNEPIFNVEKHREGLVRAFCKSKPAFELLKSIQRESKVKLEFYTIREAPRNPLGKVIKAYTNFEDGIATIRICRDDKPIEQVQSFLFELCNVQHHANVEKLERSLQKGEITSPESYALKKEQLEFITVLAHDKILTESIKAKSWPESLKGKVFGYSKSDWEAFLSHAIVRGHFQNYAKEYENYVKDRKKKSTDE